MSFAPLFPAGSVYRDEFDLAILKMQEDNRLEILKRKWWDGGKCPKEEDHRAKGLSPVNPHLLVPRLHFSLSDRVFGTLCPFQFLCLPFSSTTNPSPPSFSLLPPYPVVSRPGHGEHRRYLRGARVRPAGGYLHGSAGVCLDVKAGAGK